MDYDVLGVGNAIVDVIAPCDDAFLNDEGLAKGAMTLIDEAQAEALYAKMAAAVEASGGSAANTLAGVASFGAKAGYIGKVAADQLGDVFRHDIRAIGVDYQTPPLSGGPATARCLINVTPDAQRTMSTYLGASTLFDTNDLDETRIRRAAVVYLEGYLFDRDEAKRAFVRAAEIAAAAGAKVALTLSDMFCVERHRASFQHLVDNHVDILFANEAEFLALYEIETFAEAVENVRGRKLLAALTRSEKGSTLISPTDEATVEAVTLGPVVDTTGAGDLYASGVLFGLSRGFELETCGKLGALAAAECISHYGPRPERNLLELAQDHGLI